MTKLNDVTSARKLDQTIDTNTSDTTVGFPIIGIGASAGGLEAIEQFLSNVSVNCNMAFVVVQHLDPNYKGMLCELLQRVTPLAVKKITDRMVVMPNHVYVIPPAYDLTILNGVLLLLPRVDSDGLHLPINCFFRSLAMDKKEQSIAVILSGMGADGSLGGRAIKDQAGAVFVQTPETAKFDGMPSSAITSGLADVVAPADELMEKIVSYLNHKPMQSVDHEQDQSSVEKIIALLRSNTGHDFSRYKKSTLHRRIERQGNRIKIFAALLASIHYPSQPSAALF